MVYLHAIFLKVGSNLGVGLCGDSHIGSVDKGFYLGFLYMYTRAVGNKEIAASKTRRMHGLCSGGVSGGHVFNSDCAIFKVMKAKEALRSWIKKRAW